jgi:hypothetical protein
VERVLDEIFYAHNALTKKPTVRIRSRRQHQEAGASFTWVAHVDQKQKESRHFTLPPHSKEQADIAGTVKS